MHLSKDSKEFIACLNDAGVKFMVVGGHAVAFHGHPRFTGDTDFLIERTPDNAARVVSAIKSFGFEDVFEPSDFLDSETVLQLGRPPHRIDLLTSIDGVEFDDAWGRKVEGHLGDVKVWFLSKEDLIRNKRASGRPQDIADIAQLLE